MFEKPISVDADKMIKIIFKMYAAKRKKGESKEQASIFKADFWKENKSLAKWNESDIDCTLRELGKNNLFIKIYIDRSFRLLDQTIIYMENRYKIVADKLIEKASGAVSLIKP